MKTLLDAKRIEAILRSLRGGRVVVVGNSFFALDQESVLGKFSIDENGDTSLSKYGTYIVVDGKPVFDGIIDTAK